MAISSTAPARGRTPSCSGLRIGGLLQLLDQVQRPVEHGRRATVHESVLSVNEPPVPFTSGSSAP